MQILLAENAGFCFGVKRAIEIVYKTVENAKNNNKVYTVGPLIHNKQVINKLKEIGVEEIDCIDNIPPNSTAIIRTHGIAPDVYEKLKKNNINYVDATCPFVKKNHKIVKDYYAKGYKIIIYGDENHPEVIGINGWCNYTAVTVQTLQQLEKIGTFEKVCVVAQTTSSKEIWESIKNFIKTSCKEAVIFDTICNATYKRQEQAKKIAEKSDVMIVIGDRHSSNTRKLFDICSQTCSETYLIETASELPKSVFDKCTAGVTAGASTPEWIIKEVISIMSEEKTHNEISFAEELDKSLVDPKTGDIVKGTVIGITPTEVYVDIGFKADGVIPIDQLTGKADASIEEMVKVGDEIEAFVYRVSDVEGTVGLSVRKLEAIAGKKRRFQPVVFAFLQSFPSSERL